SGVLFRGGCNIVSNSEFVDRAEDRFFMRTEFSGDLDARAIVRELESVVGAAHIRLADNVPRRIVVLATREPHCLGDLLIRHAYGELNAEIVAVIANHSTLGSLVEKFDMPFHHVPHDGRDRAQHESELLALLGKYEPEYI